MKKGGWDKEEYYRYAKNMFDPAKVWEKPELLKSVRVLEFATQALGPLTTCLLAELGAEVIKFELPPNVRDTLPTGGDTLRHTGEESDWISKGTHILAFLVNRNKYHVTLDIANPKGREIFRELAVHSDTDVLVENLRAGAMDEMGIGYRHLSKDNPGLIYLALNGPGQWGPNADMVSYDLVGQVSSGLAYVTGFPDDDPNYPGIPTKSGNPLADTVGGVWGFSAVLAALYYRQRTGKGQFIEFSQIAGLLRLIEGQFEWYSITGKIKERMGNWDPLGAPYCIAKSKDGFVMIGAASEKIFYNICDAMGRSDLKGDPRFCNNAERVKNQKELYAILDPWLQSHTNAELRQLADRYSFPCAPVMNARDICQFPHYLVRGEIIEMEDPYYGKMKVATLPLHFSETPARIRTLCKPIGADNEYIYGKYLGYTKDDLAQLKVGGVI